MLGVNLDKTDMHLITGKAHEKWMQIKDELQKTAQQLLLADQIESAREVFEPLSNAVIAAARSFGSSRQQLFVYHCPMAFDFKGANWLQNQGGTANPYFGSTMFSCGSQTEDLTGDETKHSQEGQAHE